MIGVYAHAVAKPNHADAFEAISRELAEKTKSEEGLVSYEFGPLINDETSEKKQFAFIERWETIEALEAHMETGHFVAADEACQEHLATPMQISIYEM